MSGLTVERLQAGYRPGAPVLGDVSFALEPGTVCAVLGPNGGGKTTLFRALLGELAMRSGDVVAPGPCAYVPQTDRTRLDFPVSALDVVCMGAYARTPWWRPIGRADRRAAEAALERVGLADRASERFGSLSGGQRQRTLIARAVTQQAPVLLLDEPGSAVDATSAARIEAILRELRSEGRIVLFSTHDVDDARAWDRVLCLNERQVAFGAPAATLTPEVLRATYGDELITFGDGGQGMTLEHGHRHH